VWIENSVASVATCINDSNAAVTEPGTGLYFDPVYLMHRTYDQGAATQVYAAIDDRLDGVSGHYFEGCNPVATKGEYANSPVYL
jgi:hypothetical protein